VRSVARGDGTSSGTHRPRLASGLVWVYSEIPLLPAGLLPATGSCRAWSRVAWCASGTRRRTRSPIGRSTQARECQWRCGSQRVLSRAAQGQPVRLDRAQRTDRYEERFTVSCTAWLTNEPLKVRVTTANGSFGLDGPGWLQPACVDQRSCSRRARLEAKLTSTSQSASSAILRRRMRICPLQFA
jgi:hypothetical protein